MTHDLAKERLILDGGVSSLHLKGTANNFHPTGEHVPITPAEVDLTVLHRWQRIVSRFGSNPALEEGDRVLNYVEANALMNRVAHAILAHTVGKDVPIAILFDIETDLLISIFAIWKAGNFFVWLEPNQPVARNQFIKEEAGAPIVVTNRKHEPVARELWPGASTVIVIEAVDDDLPTNDPPISLKAESPAYLMYTSGSTGKPKGIIDIQRNLLAMLVVRQEIYHFSTHDRISLLVLASGWSFASLAALLYGGCLLPYRAREEGLIRFTQWLIDRRITISIGGSVLRTWLLTLDGSQEFPELRGITVGAGPTYAEHVRAFQRFLPAHCVLTNTYSATEIRSCSAFMMDKHTQVDTRFAPVGFPTWRVAVEIWDENDKKLPAGEVGEIIAFSPYLAAGYWKAPELTAERFGRDSQGRRFYRMGDLGRLDAGGCLWVLGRKDNQIKIRGYRVETAEVEVSLLELPNVQEAAVIHLGETDEERVLIAFVASHASITGSELRKQLGMTLPSYMVPATIVVLEELPRNSNGKVARPLLREMAAAFSMPNVESPANEASLQTETEKRVAAMVKTLLGSNIGAHDNFFDLGGHSLLAARLMLEIHRRFGVDLSPRDFFVDPTIAALARRVDLGLQGKQEHAFEPVQSKGMEAVQVIDGSPTHLPIFLCPGWNGSIGVLMTYQELFRRLGKQWPIYGLVSSASDDDLGPFANVEELVAAALTVLRQVQPQGPYLLAGECIGGKLAYEMARTLQAEGEEIALLMLLDARSRRNRPEQAASLARGVKVQNAGHSWLKWFEYHWQQLHDLGWQARAGYVGERLASFLPASLYPESKARANRSVHKRYFELLKHYEPSEPFAYPAKAVFSQESVGHMQLWQELMPDMHITMVGGRHDTYLNEAGEEVAAAFRKALQAVQSVPDRTVLAPSHDKEKAL